MVRPVNHESFVDQSRDGACDSEKRVLSSVSDGARFVNSLEIENACQNVLMLGKITFKGSDSKQASWNFVPGR